MEKLKDGTDAAMLLIAHSGDARSFAFKALQLAKKGDFDEAREEIKNAEASSVLAHQAQTDLLVDEANGIRVDINVLMVHAQDHLMLSMLALELIQEMIELHESKANREEKTK